MSRKDSSCTGAGALAVIRTGCRAVALLAVALLVAGSGSVWAQSNPSTCSKTGPALLLTELRDLDFNGVGETPIVGSKIDGETIYYQASLFISTATGQCAYEGGTLCIDRPGASPCTDVTPVGGVPLLCDNDAICNPDGVPAVDSKQIAYVVNHNDFDSGGLCDQQVRAVAEYRNGTSHFNQGVFPVNADTPICNPVLFCGDGISGNTPGETCDPPGQPGGASGNTCRANCTVCGDGNLDSGEACDDGNGVDTDSCRNNCSLPICGDGILGNTPGETCEPPGTPAGPNGNTCRGNCTVCGDGNLDSGEACDDGNGVDTDSCRNNCSLPICGDGILGNTPGETCEPPGSPAGPNNNTCRGNCTVCGDGNLDSGEACDDGNGVDTDSCRNNCSLPICGDGILGNTPGETCEPPGQPAGPNNNTCRGNCTVCGDGNLDSGEACDDGNAVNTDSCANDCTVPLTCGDGIIGNTPGETCDPPGQPGGVNNNTCRGNCTVCGDGNVDSGEACDDGNAVNTDLCANDCTIPPRCGDGIIGNTPGETCDPPGSVPEGGDNECRGNCTYCGDGNLDGGESCDDGNQADGDGCSSSCTPEESAICRTPGFWGLHAFANPNKKGSQNITQAVIDAAGGCLNVCGEIITDTDKNSADSALEAMCISIKSESRLQLARQLTAAALNCVISGGGAACVGTPLYADAFNTCNSTCVDPASTQSDVTACIGLIDCLNNGGIPLANGSCQKGVCANGDPCNEGCSDGSVCGPIPGNCHEAILVNPDLGLDFDPPGPAGSSGRCNDVIGNACKVLQPGEAKCSSGNTSSSPESCQ